MKSYVIVGLGSRSTMFIKAISEEFREHADLLAICDSNEGRINLAKNNLKDMFPHLKAYKETAFEDMLRTENPDYVIVCTKDSEHDEYICKSLECGCDVITEKPMTTDENKCQSIIDAVQQTKREVRVSFNYRYSPFRSQVKELLMEGVVGRVLSVDFQWMLDTTHGADYFRRWHRNKRNSGGLLVHKATHHFDLVNWWLSDTPVSVSARGDRLFYNEEQAERYNLKGHSNRCLDCPVKDRCNFYLSMPDYEIMKQFYLDCEKYDGYMRDQCIFSDDIDIEDTMSVAVKYKNGTILNYSLIAFSPWEGYRISFTGTKGRLEHLCKQSSYISGNGKVPGELDQAATSIKIYPHFKEAIDVPIKTGTGGHGGGDTALLNDLFGKKEKDPLNRAADHMQGAYSILVGIAANKSMEMEKVIYINKLVNGLGDAGYPPMNYNDENIPFIENASRVCNGKIIKADQPLKIGAPE